MTALQCFNKQKIVLVLVKIALLNAIVSPALLHVTVHIITTSTHPVCLHIADASLHGHHLKLGKAGTFTCQHQKTGIMVPKLKI